MVRETISAKAMARTVFFIEILLHSNLVASHSEFSAVVRLDDAFVRGHMNIKAGFVPI
jgi:hypothetical protein